MSHQRCTRIKSALHAEFFWRDQRGQTVKKKPRVPTVFGTPIEELHPQCRERGRQNPDRWTPVVLLYMSMARVIVYEGTRAQSIWKDFCAGVYGKRKSNA